MKKLSVLKKVPLRDVWAHEAADFTSWLAREENLALLGEEIGIEEIALIQTEQNVGSYRADILAEDAHSGRKIVIENQLEVSDHDHLGKIITYASGIGAEVVVWIVEKVRDEHRQAVEWLNEHTDDRVNIFAIQIEVWQIDDSNCAPRFHVIAAPNDWAKAVKKTASSGEFSDTQLRQLEYWRQFKEYAEQHQDSGNFLKLPRNMRAVNWLSIHAGFKEVYIDVYFSHRKKIGCELTLYEQEPLFAALHSKQAEIEAALGHALEWREMPGRKSCKIVLMTDGDLSAQEEWATIQKWMLQTAQNFQRVFVPHVREFINAQK